MIYINQVNKTDCRLATVLHNYGSKISLATLRKFTKTTTDGTAALGIVKAAEKLKMDVEAYQADASLFDSKDVIYPFIAHLIKKTVAHFTIVLFLKVPKNIFLLLILIYKLNVFLQYFNWNWCRWANWSANFFMKRSGYGI
ncbi:hypothetical protein DL317_06430 [Limosilactobacillus reuteri]|uniref:cysteine peptidase family C39 domain-containing protein n=1 Tax=Limosilactobacillus reuteri TaxID=1598 RepID=UPI000DEA8596|nr:hypothetical protein DL317_06430 [Limosilactobacillus reuteri]